MQVDVKGGGVQRLSELYRWSQVEGEEQCPVGGVRVNPNGNAWSHVCVVMCFSHRQRREDGVAGVVQLVVRDGRVQIAWLLPRLRRVTKLTIFIDSSNQLTTATTEHSKTCDRPLGGALSRFYMEGVVLYLCDDYTCHHLE